MHVHALDRFEARDSALHRSDPRLKIVLTLAVALSNAALPDGSWLAMGCMQALLVLAALAGGLRPWYAVVRSAVALPFMLAATTVAFVTPGVPVAQIALGPWVLTPTVEGLERLASIVLRALLSVQVAILLTATTRVPDLLHALGHLGVPSALVSVVGLMVRYLTVLVDEAQRLMRGTQSRSAAGPDGTGGSVFWRARVAGSMVGQLFLRSYERSERVHQAMLARGMDGRHLTLYGHVVRRRDHALAIIAIVGLIAVHIIARAIPIR
ncbi:MAG: cobalt ECF transporter T component CbiQ [Chloroflexi bacterium]|nr:cobalt ECF transporter T component CbiQ [Chloroflexota bacterium]